MYKSYIKYNIASGKILSKLLISLDEDISLQPLEVGEAYKEVSDEEYNNINENQYYNGTAVVPRISMEIIQDGTNFTNIPINLSEGTKLFISNTEYEVTEDNVTLNIDTPGRYVVIFKGFPYLDTAFRVAIP